MDLPVVSIVIPVYNEEKQIKKSYEAISKKLPIDEAHFNFIFVDDGSSDGTWNELMTLAKENSNVRSIKLSRNFGKEAALCAGIEAVTSNACITMDSDLQHPPDLIPEMIRLWKYEGYEVVEGIKASRGRERLLNKAGALIFYYIMYKLSGVKLNNASDFKLMDKKVVRSWNSLNEHDTFLRGMSAWLGYKRTSIPFSVVEREIGGSKWSFFKLFRLAINAITSFSSLPLHIVTIMGVLFLIGSIILSIHTLYRKLTGSALDGFTTMILLQLIIGSTLMLSIGIIGSYIARIFNEVKRRPRYLISKEVTSENNESSEK